MARPEDTIHNEHIKLAATALNNVGVASVVTGVIVPLAGCGKTSKFPVLVVICGGFFAFSDAILALSIARTGTNCVRSRSPGAIHP